MDMRASVRPGVTQEEQFTNLDQGEAQRLSAAHKIQPVQVPFGIKSKTSRRTKRFRYQTLFFIEADSIYGEAAANGHSSDLQSTAALSFHGVRIHSGVDSRVKSSSARRALSIRF